MGVGGGGQRAEKREIPAIMSTLKKKKKKQPKCSFSEILLETVRLNAQFSFSMFQWNRVQTFITAPIGLFCNCLCMCLLK